MRGSDQQQAPLFSYLSLEERVPPEHPLRAIRQMVDTALMGLGERCEALYAHTGRPAIAPERLLRALLLHILYWVRSERLLMEQVDSSLLFRWFVGLTIDEAVWGPTVFPKNRERLLAGEVAHAFFGQVLARARGQQLWSSEHFRVDGTLIEAWAGLKSLQPKANPPAEPPDDLGNPSVDFGGEKRPPATHASTADPDARLYKEAKGQGAKLGYLGQVLMENRTGLIVNPRLTQATGTAEREAAVEMVGELPGTYRVTVGGDKASDPQDFVQDLRAVAATPHVAQNTTNRTSAIDGRTTRHEGDGVSQHKRERVEEIWGWQKTVGLLRKVRPRGLKLVGGGFPFPAPAYNLVRLQKLAEAG